MPLAKLQVVICALAISLLQGGCALGRRTVPLTVPAVEAPAATKGKIYISSVSDLRAFENNPGEPSTPSVDGDVNTYTADQKSVMIGRQRGGYGKALGDIALPADDSVPKCARRLAEEALKRGGYQIATDANAPASATVSIEQFWAWFTPGFWSVAFEARVYCTVTITNRFNSGKIVVQGYGLNRGQVASDANWQLAYARAFEDFLAKFQSELSKR